MNLMFSMQCNNDIWVLKGIETKLSMYVTFDNITKKYTYICSKNAVLNPSA